MWGTPSPALGAARAPLLAQPDGTGPLPVRRPAVFASTPTPRRVLLLPFALFGVTLLLIAAHQGKLVELFFPLGSFLIALKLYRRSPAHYVGFVCWLFFLSPEVRRLADFMTGSFSDKSLIMVAPLLAVALSGLSLLTDYPTLAQRRGAPVVLVLLALFYAFVVGMVRAGPVAAGFTLVNWLFPMLVAFRVITTWRDYPVYHRVLLKTFVYGGIVTGLYGVIQFVQPPPWDVFWVLASGMDSIGKPVPYGLRICSTMNSAGPFAVAIMSMVLMSFAARGPLRIVACVGGIPSLLFTSVRTAWGGWFIGLLFALVMLDGKSRVRLVGAALGFVLLCSPVLMIDEVAAPILARFTTLQNLSDDNSYQARTQFYHDFLESSLTDIAGQGLGATGMGAKLSEDSSSQGSVVFDSGLMEVPYVMGWPGTLLYVTGLALLFARGFRAVLSRSKDRFAASAFGVALAIFAMMVFANTLNGLSGMLFFLGLVLPVIAQRYEREKQRALQPARRASR